MYYLNRMTRISLGNQQNVKFKIFLIILASNVHFDANNGSLIPVKSAIGPVSVQPCQLAVIKGRRK